MNNISHIQEKLVLVGLALSKARREFFRKDFSKFRKYYFPHCHQIPDGIFQAELCSILQGMLLRRGQKAAIAAPRGFAKSLISTFEFVIYCICYKLEDFIVIISNTQEQAEGHLSHIKNELGTNNRLIEDFPDICEFGKKLGPPRWRSNEIITANLINVLALGTGQQIRGRRHREFRPTLVILDDVETDESTQSLDSYYKLYDWMTKSVFKAGSSSTNTIFIGTIHHYNSLLAQFTHLTQHPGWVKRIYRAIINWAEDVILWEKWRNIFNFRQYFQEKTGPEAAEVFFKEHQEQMLKGTELLWPQKTSYYELMYQREEEGYISFDSEMQNEPVNPRDCIFNLAELHYWDDHKTQEELLASIDSDYTMLGACDPSLGKDLLHGDYSAILTAVRDNKTKILYILDADIEKRAFDKTIQDIIAHHRCRKYSRFAFETNQFQEYAAEQLEKGARETGHPLALEKIKHTSDKILRIQSLQPLVKNGTVQFSRRHHTLLEQMRFFPRGKNDDGPDALEMLVQLSQSYSGEACVYVTNHRVY